MRKYWIKISGYGVRDNMSIAQQKKMVLTNQLSVIAFVLFMAFMFFGAFVEGWSFDWTMVASVLSICTLLFIPLTNKKSKRAIGGFLIAVPSSIAWLYFPISNAVLNEFPTQGYLAASHYYLAKSVLLACIVFPMVLIDKHERVQLIVALTIAVLCFFAHDPLLTYFNVRVIASEERGVFSLFDLVTLLPVLILVFSILFLNTINNFYEKQVMSLATNLKKKNKEITDSINYASKIQSVILPPEEQLKKYFSDFFVFFKPRDIVSGDFYFFEEVGGKAVVAAADCTGHGVPGALLSMLGSAFLNEIILSTPNLGAGEILDKLREKFKSHLSSGEESSQRKEGMDIALCVIDKQKNILEYAGAFNPLVLIRNEKVETYRATRNPIGTYRKEIPFEANAIDLIDGDCVYLFSDGYMDQFHKSTGEKFKKRRFLELLSSLHSKPMVEQKELLGGRFNDWRGDKEHQLDDVLVFGFRYKSTV